MNVVPKPFYTAVKGGFRKKQIEEDEFIKDASLSQEEYILEITVDKITVTASTERGRYYARKTLSLLPYRGALPILKIKDRPRFSYRAFMIDSARHMQSVDELKRYIEAAALLKFNYFHWHLCDDQGFRIETEKYPTLLSVGAYRDSEGFGSKSKEKYGGYYTKEEIREIVSFCAERYIEVIPEIDLPGHSSAILASYPELSCRKKPLPVRKAPGIYKDIMCAGREEVFDFCFGLLEEVSELFPCEYFHIGGDEAPKVRWESCPDCNARMKAQGLSDYEQLQGYFTSRIAARLEQLGKKPIVWNESLKGGSLSKSVTVADWMDKEKLCINWANGGGKIIAEDFYSLYLDYPYGMTPLEKTYSFNPVPKELTKAGRACVWGVEAPIWTEFVKDFDRMCYMCFPRLLAAAEIAWTSPERLCYKAFENRAEGMREALLNIGIKMPERKVWNPKGVMRIRDIASHYKRLATSKMIKDFINREE